MKESLFANDIDKLYAIEDHYGPLPEQFTQISIDLVYEILIEEFLSEEKLLHLIEKNNITPRILEKFLEYITNQWRWIGARTSMITSLLLSIGSWDKLSTSNKESFEPFIQRQSQLIHSLIEEWRLQSIWYKSPWKNKWLKHKIRWHAFRQQLEYKRRYIYDYVLEMSYDDEKELLSYLFQKFWNPLEELIFKWSKYCDFVALCPFHPEKTPSLKISKRKNIMKCFWCWAAWTFVTMFPLHCEWVSMSQVIGTIRKRLEDKQENDESTGKTF